MIYQTQKTKSIVLSYIFVAQLGAVVVIPLLMLLLPELSETARLGISIIVSFIVGFGLILFLMRHEIKDMMSHQKDWKKVVMYGISGFLAAVLLQTILNPVITLLTDGSITNESEKMLTEMARMNWLFIFIPIIIGPILEEIVFRYAILGSLMKRMKPSYAILISSILFGLAHFSPVNIIVYVCLGIIFSTIYIRSRSLFASIIAHVLMNSLVMILYLLGIN